MSSKKNRPYNTVIAMLFMAISFILPGCGETLTDAEYVARAKEYQAKGESNAAVIELKNALKTNPDNIEARWLLGNMYLDAGLGAVAEKELRRAMDLGMAPAAMAVPYTKALLLQGKFQEVLDYDVDHAGLDRGTVAKLWALQGHAQLALKGQEEATKAYDMAQSINVQEPEALLGRAHIAFREQKLDTARQLLDQALAADPTLVAAWSLSGDLARNEGQLEKAEADYGMAVALQEWTLNERINRALVRILMQKYDGAKEDISFVRSKVRQSPEADYAQGLIHLQQDNLSEAQISLERALSANSKYYPAMFFLGVTHYLQEHDTQARSYLNQYTRQFPNNVRARQMLAVLDIRDGKHADARERLMPVLELYPDDLLTLKLMTTAAMKLGDSAGAIEYMRKVAEQEPDSGDARLRLGLGLMLQGEHELGGVELQKAVELDSDIKVAEVVLVMDQLNQGKLKEALEAARAFTDRQPESPMAWNLLGLAQIKNDQINAARESFERALAVVPGEPGAANNLAQLALKRGDVDEAIRLYESVVEHHPGHMATVVRLAKLKVHQGRQSELKELMEKTIASYPQALEPRVILGDIYLQKAEPEKALSLLLEVQEELSGDPRYWDNLGRMQRAAGDMNAAVYCLERMVELQPRSVRANQLLAEAYGDIGDLDKLEVTLNRALELAPDHYPSRSRKVSLLIKRNRLEEANRLLQELQADYPEQPGVTILQASLALAQDKPQEAVTAFQKAVKQNPTPDLVGQLALAQWEAGQREAGYKTLEDWLKNNPENTMVRYNLANLYMAGMRYEDARQAFSMVIEAHPTHLRALINLALLTRKADPDKALGYASFILSLAPESPVAQDVKAQILLDRGEVEQAIRLLEQAVEKAPNDLQIRYHWVQALAHNGETGKAKQELEQILGKGKRFGGDEEARVLLKELSRDSE